MAFSFGGGGDTGSSFSFGNFGATTSGSTSTTAPAAGGFSFAAPSTSTSTPAAGGFAFGAPAATTSTTTTAPASTGFAFGAPSTSNTTTSSAPTSSLFSLSSTPASTTTTTTTTAPATTGFNFSFGGDTGATTTTTTSNTTTTTAPAPATTTAPLSFAFGDTGTSTTTSILPTFSLDTKSSTAPTTDAFSFAAPAASTSSSSSSTTTTSTTSTSTTTTTGTIDPSSRIKNKTVDEIINLWSRDLEDHVQSFTEQAIEVKKWDTQMIENLNKIVKLQGSVTNVQSSQVKLNRILETIKINQQDLTTMIDNLEKAVDQTSKRNLTPDEMKREEAYRLAEEIDSQLMVMSDSLQETVRTLNTSAERHADPNNPFTQILKILNIQMTSLQWIEQTSQQLEGELSQAQQVVRTAKADTRTTSNALNGYRR